MLENKSVKNINKGTDHCVCCGEDVPEGRMVCKNCENKFLRDKSS